jgi:hypothetical protein
MIICALLPCAVKNISIMLVLLFVGISALFFPLLSNCAVAHEFALM